jgi:hypothetical protein
MEPDAAILAPVREVFSDCPRPEHFTNYEHCEECRDHDDVLRSRYVKTLSIEDVGNGGWDPLCFISPEGFAYFFPALARLVLDEPTGLGWYGPNVLFHLTQDHQCRSLRRHFSPAKKAAVLALLRHIRETRQKLVAS